MTRRRRWHFWKWTWTGIDRRLVTLLWLFAAGLCVAWVQQVQEIAKYLSIYQVEVGTFLAKVGILISPQIKDIVGRAQGIDERKSRLKIVDSRILLIALTVAAAVCVTWTERVVDLKSAGLITGLQAVFGNLVVGAFMVTSPEIKELFGKDVVPGGVG